ncbi:MAG TPA: DUF5455 family protein [Rhodocyclaceae bacterium]|nr:DUF5455 family protein [Rhodocyclaceae bacterium]
MQLLSAFLTAAFSKLFEFFATYVGKKVAIGGAVVATSLVLLTAFWVVIRALVAGLIHQVSNPQMLMAFYALWPSNAEACLSAYWTAQLMAFVYREHRENLRAMATVS